MSNSPLVSYTLISPNKTSPRNHKIDTITIHCVVGQLSAETICQCFTSPSRKASCNYGIGTDGRISLCVDEKDRSWCSSNAANDHRAITIECASDLTHPYAINAKVYQSLIELCADICRRNDIKELKWKADKSLVGQVDKQNMTAHRWFANKSCPGDYIYNRLGQIADEVNAKLKSQEEEDMDVERFKELWLEMRKELQDNDAGSWSQEARDWAVSTGLIQGSSTEEFNGMWGDVLTREQMAVLLYRFAKLMGKA